MDELLALIGQHWRLVLIYPGGLTALGALLMLLRLDRTPLRGTVSSTDVGTWLAATTWLLLIALLPLPQTGWPYDLDVVTLLLAIELPFWLSARPQIKRTDAELGAMVALLAPPLNVYPLLALACVALGQAAGSLVVHEINRSAGLLHWIGLVAWSLALPPLLHLGPWRNSSISALWSLRRLAHLGLLLSVALPAHDNTSIASAALGFAAIALPLAALDRWWRGAAQGWITWQPWLVAALMLLLAWTSGQRLAGRLVG